MVLLTSFLGTIGLLSNPAEADMTWLLENVDSSGAAPTSIAVDSAGNPWILYAFSSGVGGISLAHWTGSSWFFEWIVDGGGSCLSLALDGLDRPRIVHDFDTAPWPGLRDIYYVYWTGSSWANETIESVGDVGASCSLALDSLGRPHVSYYDYTWNTGVKHRDLKYAWRDASSWHNETVDSLGQVGIDNSIALDSLDRPHIAYGDIDNNTLKYAWWDGSKWNIDVPDSSGEVVPSPASIRLDSTDRPHIAYLAQGALPPGQLRYASWNGASWTIEPAALINSISSSDSVCLRLDSANQPSIAYTNGTGFLSFTSKQGGLWVVENIDAGGGSVMGIGASLALDSGGNPHIAYADDSVQLKYAHRGMDSFPPSSAVDTVNPYWATSSRVITATASDGESRVSNVTLWYRFSPDNASWGSWKAHQMTDLFPWSWTFSFPDGQGYYQFYSIAVDTGANMEPPPPLADAIAAFEQTKPSSILQSVPSYWFNSTALTLTATASDAPSGVAIVDLYYSYSGNNASWGAWTLYQTDKTPPWSWDFSFPMGSGWYRLYSLARDRAGNVENPPASQDLELALDRTPPTSMVDQIPGAWHRSSVDVAAQASDSQSGVANVALGYRHSPDEVSWSPWTYFQTDPLPPWSWLFTFPDGDGFYQFHSIGTDNASNSEWFKDWPESNATCDVTPPTATVNQSPPYWKNASTILTASVSDMTSGVENATLWYCYSLDNSSWGTWQSFATDIAPPWSWLFDFPDGAGRYQFQATAFDLAGNEDPLGSVWEAEIGFDPDAPSSSLTVRSPGVSVPPVTWVTSSTSLNLTAHDDNGSGIASIRYRTWHGSWSPWSDYSTEFNLAGTDGLRYIEFQAHDLAGNSGMVENRTIVLDNTPPATTLSIGDPRYLVGGNFVRSSTPLTLLAVDGGVTPVGLDYTEYRVDGGNWKTYSSPFPLAGEGAHTLEYRSRDLLGNSEAVQSMQTVVDDVPPATTISIGEPKYLNGGTHVNSSTPLAFSAVDGSVGSNSTFYRLWWGSWSPWREYSTSFSLAGRDGTWYVEFLSFDYLVNTETIRNETLILDDTPPTTIISPAAPFTLTGTDSGSGVNVTKYSIDGGSWTVYTGSFTLTEGEHTIYYYSIDNLGNIEQERSLVVKPPTEVAVNYQPIVALIFTIILLVAGVWSSRRRRWKNGKDGMAVMKAFTFTSMPFVVAEAATGIASLLTGQLSMPPMVGVGTALDLAILLAGLAVAILRVRTKPSEVEKTNTPQNR